MNGLSGGEHSIAAQQPPQKPLRFVTNYGAPHPKRRRIGAACLTCRKRKTACSGERPTCETCAQNRLECAGYSSETTAPGQKRKTSDAAAARCDDTNGSDERSNKRPAPNAIKQEYGSELTLLDGHHNGITYPPQQAPRASMWPTCDPQAQDVTADATRGRQLHQQSSYEIDEQEQDSLFSGPRNRMPYFRWLGPTAIMPGFKQMVVKVKRQDTDMTRSSTNGDAAGATVSPTMHNLNPNTADQRMSSMYSNTPLAPDNEVRTPLNLPFYDTSSVPPSELITHLANTFFTHLGCNYPFLQKERFTRDLEEKQVDPVLVDAVCALAARFSTHSLITQQTTDEHKPTPAEYGHSFGMRAKQALVDTFPCPSVAAVQAALLLAYLEFGESRDSGLWMYLGISIRMAQDLGLHKVEGLKYRGKDGPTPKMIKRESMSGSPELPTKLVSGKNAKDEELEKAEKARDKVVRESTENMVEAKDLADNENAIDEQKAVEQERVDTFWAVFFLDRMVSSGTGRRCALRDKDIELSFPTLEETDPKSGWPTVFPALIRIVHLYGRVADLLNSIKEPSDITTETPKRIASMESQVTNFYQGLSSRLHFDAVNFQHYMKAGEGTNFVLLHFWFHTLIVLMHRPTSFKTFEGRMLQLFPNSQQLSMSSAKTIADILSYSQLMDAKASLGNPFTTQPIYIAACAFLKESVEQSATSKEHSRTSSPERKERKEEGDSRPQSARDTPPPPTPSSTKRISISELSNPLDEQGIPRKSRRSTSIWDVEQHQSPDKRSSDKSEHSALSASRTASALAKHTLLATAANQHYQLCYKALQSLETYWAGTKYILTILDQKFQGAGDPLLYTMEEADSSMEKPNPEPSFTTPGWRRKLSWGPYLYGPNVGIQAADFWKDKAGQMPESPNGGIGKAIGWTLTGTMNSPSTSLAWHYPSATSDDTQQHQQRQHPPSGQQFNPPSTVTNLDHSSQDLPYDQHFRTTSTASQQHPPMLHSYPSNASAVSNGDASSIMMGLDSQYQPNTNPTHAVGTPSTAPSMGLQHQSTTRMDNGHNFVHNNDNGAGAMPWNYSHLWDPNNASMSPFGDMMIESQDVDMSMLGLDMMPWFGNYSQDDFNGLFDPGGQHAPNAQNGASHGGGAQGTPQG